MSKKYQRTLQWSHNERDSISNHQCLNCLLKDLLRHRSKKISKLCVTDLCEGNSLVNSPTQGANNVENVSIWWRHHDWSMSEKKSSKKMPSLCYLLNVDYFVEASICQLMHPLKSIPGSKIYTTSPPVIRDSHQHWKLSIYDELPRLLWNCGDSERYCGYLCDRVALGDNHKEGYVEIIG